MAKKIIEAMNERLDDYGFIEVMLAALKELGASYYFDNYTNQWCQSNGYTKTELARMRMGR